MGSDELSISSFEEINHDNFTKFANNPSRIQSGVDVKTQKFVNHRSNPRTKTVAQFQSKSSNNFSKVQPIVIQPTNPTIPDKPKVVLLGFLYISRAQFSREVSNSYVSCNLFGEDEIVNSKPIALDSSPTYNFCQVGLNGDFYKTSSLSCIIFPNAYLIKLQRIPLIYEDKLVLGLRENCMVIEIREKDQAKDFLVGISTVSLHPFYLAFRNFILVKYLLEKQVS